MNFSNILDRVLPYTTEELRCGLKKRGKINRRMALLQMMNDWHEHKEVDFSTILSPDELQKFNILFFAALC